MSTPKVSVSRDIATELLPCPFCGNVPVITTDGTANQFLRIVCGKKEWCVMVHGTGYFEDRSVLVAAWNTRADSSAANIQKLREAAKKALTCATLNSDARALIVDALALTKPVNQKATEG